MQNGKRALLARLQRDVGNPQWLYAVPATPEGRRLAPQFRPLDPRARRHQLRRRPANAVKTVAELLQTHRDPREVLLEMAETHVADVAAMLNCSLLEAWQEKRLAALGVLPYIARKMPLQVDLDTRAQVELTIVAERLPLELDGDDVEIVPNFP